MNKVVTVNLIRYLAAKELEFKMEMDFPQYQKLMYDYMTTEEQLNPCIQTLVILGTFKLPA